MNFNPFLINQNQPPADAQGAQQGLRYSATNSFGSPAVNMNQVSNPNRPTGPDPNQQVAPKGQNIGNQVAAGAAGAMSSYAQGAAATNNFSIDTEAGLKGSFQGLAQGGPVMAVVQGIAGQIGTMSEVRRNLNKVNPNIVGYTNDAYGNPVYNGQGVNELMGTDREIGVGQKKLKRAWDPASRLGGALFGLNRRMRNKREEINRGILAAQTGFNTANIANEQQQQAKEAYNKSLKEIFNSPTSLPSQYNVF
jgi:hypothetical protein